ncbi:MAG: peptidyl-prolyl cis-trans isomerase [Victivallales bacterium]|nr:peptidyl-prolyl cis-trans isomerase [Victivallales bacterium]
MPVTHDKGRILATVNGKPITLLAVLAETTRAERESEAVLSGKKLEMEINKIRRQAVDDIIARELVSEMFDLKGYTVPDQVIENMLDVIAADMAGGDRKLLESQARQAGVSMDFLKQQAHIRAATMMLISARCYRDVFVTPKQVHDFYTQNIGNFRIPNRINLQILYLKSTRETGTGNIDQFAVRLAPNIIGSDEKTFTDYVSKYSVGPNRDSGGDAGWLASDQLRKEFAEALAGMSRGDITGPVRTQEGFYFLRIKDIEEEKFIPFEEVKDHIKTELENKQKDDNYQKFIGKLREKAVIRYLDNDIGGQSEEATPEP